MIQLVLCFCVFGQTLVAQTTEFTYQGSLKDGANLANGNYDFEFVLFDAVSGGGQLGSTLTRSGIAVANGIFSVKLDFGNQFSGADRFMEIRVRPTGQPGITILTPRQILNSAPYSVKSINATNADTAANSTQLGGVAANQFVLTTDTRMTDARAPLPNSSNYIQNSITQQAASNFSISGNGSVGGNFGIGTPSPQNVLHLNGNSNDFAITFTNAANSVGRRGYRLAFDSNRFTFQRADDTGLFQTNHVAIDQATGNVGLGTTASNFKLQVIDTSNTGLRVQTNSVGGTVASFGGNGAFNIDAPGVTGGRFTTLENGNVGIGTNNPTQKLYISGTGGIRANVNSDSNAGLGLSLNNSIKWSLATVNPGQFQIFNQTLNSNALWIDNASNNVGIGVTDPSYLLDVGQRMRLRSGGNNSVSAGIHFNNNANNIAAFVGMEDDTHIGFFGNNGAGWKFGMNTINGALKVNGDEGQAGQVITSNGSAAAQWKSSTNLLNQRTNMNNDTGEITPGNVDTAVPGLSQTVNVSGNAKLLAQFGVFTWNGSCVGCGASTAQIYLTLDGSTVNTHRQDIANGSSNFITGSWLMAVGAGTHTIGIKAWSFGPLVNFGYPPGSGPWHSYLIVQVIPE